MEALPGPSAGKRTDIKLLDVLIVRQAKLFAPIFLMMNHCHQLKHKPLRPKGYDHGYFELCGMVLCFFCFFLHTAEPKKLSTILKLTTVDDEYVLLLMRQDQSVICVLAILMALTPRRR